MSPQSPSVYREELTPIRFLERAGQAFASRVAVSDEGRQFNWHEFRSRARRLASALQELGVQPGDRVAWLALNGEPLLLAHYAVPMAGAVLVSINTRLKASEVAWILQHSGARQCFYSRDLRASVPALHDVTCLEIESRLEELIQSGDDRPPNLTHVKESDMIAINYTSGTTGKPKGVMYHHRGAYLNALAMTLEHRLTAESRYLWTLPMFHCNGWTFTWAVSIVGAESVALPRFDAGAVWRFLQEGITHFCAAPTLLNMLLNHPLAVRLEHRVRVFTAGAPPAPTLVSRMLEFNFELDHVYGLTETYGPFTINVPQPEDLQLPVHLRAQRLARQGLANTVAGQVRVVNAQMDDVPWDGATLGEVVMRGNGVMTGYYRDPSATDMAFQGGWFHTGDLAVIHADGYLELRDRKKDIIISGGENISTIEVEQVIVSHPSVADCAVIAIPDDHWGEVPMAFVAVREGNRVTAEELVVFCRERLAHFKVPKRFEFGDLPRTSTGKIQKFLLREREWSGHDKRIH